eukprot:m.433136 g.433136  ORF g.433136 m.433136 type:complete len:213 (-) comp17536_c0_seq1:1853-2491(-)
MFCGSLETTNTAELPHPMCAGQPPPPPLQRHNLRTSAWSQLNTTKSAVFGVKDDSTEIVAMARRLLMTAGRAGAAVGPRTQPAPRLAARCLATKVDERNIDPDYPDLPLVSSQRRDPFKYWDSQDRRNFAEPLQEHDEALSMWVVDDVSAGDTVSPNKQVVQLLMMFGALGLLMYAAYVSNPFAKKPVKEKEFPPNDIPKPLTGYPGAAESA